MINLSLSLVKNDKELPNILAIQKAAFKELYIKYKDKETSPFKDSLEDINQRYLSVNSYYYFIKVESLEVGFLRVIVDSNLIKARISPIAILPKYENKGYGKKALLELETLFPSIGEWNLATIKEESKLVKFYTDLDYKLLEKEIKLNDQMHLSLYRKIRQVDLKNTSENSP
ncbi:MAG: GNAT family N-acetyltransferase [Alkalibacterium sp.]|nr:GNAT family N-acetyltransferase [Alkalibacterium sp.]